MMGAVSWIRRHQVWVMRLGGAMLVTVGILMLTGTWASMVEHVQTWAVGFDPAI
jgi:cytochrome c-type biogenesis protein